MRYPKLRKKIRLNTNGRKSITPEEFNKLNSALCEEFGKIKEAILESVSGVYNVIPLTNYNIVENYIAIFTDASSDEGRTGYAIYVSPKNIFNRGECLPFASNNRAETFAVLQVIRRLPPKLNIKIFTDSKITIQRIQNTKRAELVKNDDAELSLEIQARMKKYIKEGGNIIIEHIYSHLDEGNSSVKKEVHLQELKKKYPRDWEKIIHENKTVDKMAKDARRRHPSFSYPPSIFGTRIIIQSNQGEIIQSAINNKIKRLSKIEQTRIYNQNKPNQRQWHNLTAQKYTQKFDERLMKSNEHRISSSQDFLFKIKYNKLLTKKNVRERALKYKQATSSHYEDSICPSCKIEEETILHVMQCKSYDSWWNKAKIHLISMINGYCTMSKHDEWKENFIPYSREIKDFPIWWENRESAREYPNFEPKLGRVGILPENISEKLKKLNMKESLLDECIYEIYCEIWRTMKHCWLKRCKNLFNRNNSII